MDRLRQGPRFALPLVCGAAWLLASCATVPEALEPVPEAQPGIAEVRSDPDAWMGTDVVWGGVIARVSNEPDGTRLEIVARPLTRAQRPQIGDRSEGRFRVFFGDFLDPQVYAPMREVTVRGRVTGVSAGSIGEFPYRFPEVAAASIHLWPLPEPAVIYRDPFWDPFWDPWRPYHRYPWGPRGWGAWP
ncbi:Slp family lipoprotein [Thioalkalivibrio paradoxus]|uniref:Membrane protein n=1 Tax=Thioalkalivibrio paradoxus ARh 1 TaxID=713585 RepID=W0DRH0_9GAMM|nr:Slp family lipoprotein [Thioalkalivibrio paradoxus]AHE99588.1 membrane protein [Thioalkalivibrio paradoxus ARh 1]